MAASSRLVNLPVHSNTTSTPRSFHGSCAGSFIDEDLELVAVDRDRALARLDCRREVAEHRVVLQQVRERLGVGDVVHRDEVDVAWPRAARMMLRPMRPNPLMPTFSAMYESSGVNGSFYTGLPALRGTRCLKRYTRRDVSPLMYTFYSVLRAGGLRDRLAVVPLPGPPLQEIRRQPRPADGLSARFVQHRRRRIDLDSRGVGRRGADGAAADRRAAASAIPNLRIVPVDDDDCRAAAGAAQRARTWTRCSISRSISALSSAERSTW